MTAPHPSPTIPVVRGGRLRNGVGFYTRTTPFMLRARRRHGPVFSVNIGDSKSWIVFSEPEHVKAVFTGDPAVFHAGKANSILLPLLGPASVLVLDDSAHLRQRKLLLPPFHGERMERYGAIMREATTSAVESWPTGVPMRLAPEMQAITLHVIMRAVFGLEEGAQLERLGQQLVTMIDEVTRPSYVAAFALFGPDRMSRSSRLQRTLAPADDSILAEITARRTVTDLAERDDILSLLLLARDDAGQPLTDSELRDELVTLLVAGHETTASVLSWTIERLVRNPAVFARLRSDLDAGSTEYLDAVVRETLRLRPVLPVVVRDLQADAQIGEYRLPAGSRVACSIHLAHRNPNVYPDPHTFRPERWLGTTPGTYTWIPFGGGIRRCLGASFALFETQQILAGILASLDIEATSPAFERTKRRMITLTPARGTEVCVRPRQRSAGGSSSSPPSVPATR